MSVSGYADVSSNVVTDLAALIEEYLRYPTRNSLL